MPSIPPSRDHTADCTNAAATASICSRVIAMGTAPHGLGTADGAHEGVPSEFGQICPPCQSCVNIRMPNGRMAFESLRYPSTIEASQDHIVPIHDEGCTEDTSSTLRPT